MEFNQKEFIEEESQIPFHPDPTFYDKSALSFQIELDTSQNNANYLTEYKSKILNN